MHSPENQSHWQLASRLTAYAAQRRIPEKFRVAWKQTFAVDPVIESMRYLKGWRGETRMIRVCIALIAICVIAFSAAILLPQDAHSTPAEKRSQILIGVVTTLAPVAGALLFRWRRSSITIMRTYHHRTSLESPNEILFLYIIERAVMASKKHVPRDIRRLEGSELTRALQEVLYEESRLLNSAMDKEKEKVSPFRSKKLSPEQERACLQIARFEDVRWHLDKLGYVKFMDWRRL